MLDSSSEAYEMLLRRLPVEVSSDAEIIDERTVILTRMKLIG